MCAHFNDFQHFNIFNLVEYSQARAFVRAAPETCAQMSNAVKLRQLEDVQMSAAFLIASMA